MQCAACGFIDDTVTPSDAAVALRSYPRRYRAALVRPDDDEAGLEVLRRPAADGWSALDHAAHAAASFAAVAEALRLVSIEESPVVALTPERRDPGAGTAPLDEVLLALETAAVDAADAIGRITGKDWERGGRLDDGGSRSALDLARHAAHEGVHHLRAAERAVREAVSAGP